MFIDRKSIKTKMLLLLLSVILAITSVVILISYQFAEINSENYELRQEQLIQNAVLDVESSLGALSDFLIEFIAENDLMEVVSDLKNVQSWANLLEIQRDLSRSLSLQPSIAGVYVYFGNIDYLLTVNGKSYSSTLSSERYNYWAELAEITPVMRRWVLKEIGGELMLTYNIYQGPIVLSAVVSLDSILTSFDEIDTFSFIDETSQYYFQHVDNQYRQVNKAIAADSAVQVYQYDFEGFEMGVHVNSKLDFSLGKFWSLAALIIISIICIGILYFYINRWIINPILKLRRSFHEVQSGIPEVSRLRTDNKKVPSEFLYLNYSFITLVSDLQTEKMISYENQNRIRKEEIRHLQKQMRPHFLLNCLNNIYSFSHFKDYQKIQRLTIYLSSYLRYLSSNDNNLDSIENELLMFRNYMKIQTILYPNEVCYEINCQETLLSERFLSMFIINAAENAMKHGFKRGHSFCVSVNVFMANNGICIRIADNGTGYPNEVLHNFDNDLDQYSNSHTGIVNAKRRLNLTYGELAQMKLYNSAENGGSITEVFIMIPEKEEEQE